ncbi:VOC family protein [Xylanibacillus composti]|nr:VOC family protein [Xylanibacillus composti]MDT9724074.1 VOC family protein [Xylanibacillus composti]
MFKQVGQIMVYVNNQEAVRDFWTEKFGFHVVDDVRSGEMRWIEMSPSENAATTIILHDRAFVAKMNPEMNLDTPSLMFFTDNLDQLHADLANKQVKVGDIVAMPTGSKVFNFADNEDNYFAVMEK